MFSSRSLERAGPTGEDARRYPPSWYAATIATPFAAPALDHDVQADACVVGGGYTGLGAATRLAEAGRAVVCVESGPIGWGASGRNGGQVHVGWNKDQAWLARHCGEEAARALWAMALAARDDLDRLLDHDPDRCDLRPGLIHADHKPAHVADSHAHVRFMREAYGYADMVALGRAELAGMVASDAYFGGLRDARGGHLHPLKLALAFFFFFFFFFFTKFY